MVEHGMGWERYELKRWRFGNDGIKRMGIGGLEMGGGVQFKQQGSIGLEENGGVKFRVGMLFSKKCIQMKTTIMGGI